VAKAIFLKYFQKNLCSRLQKLIINEWGYDNLTVSTEKADIPGTFSGFIDLCITKRENSCSLVAIEIEHLSSYEQAKKNIEKKKAWAHNSNYRQCGFLHILNSDCYLSTDNLSNLVRSAKNHERKGLGFYYDFVFYEVENTKMTKATAQNIVDSKDFQTRILMLLENAEMV
jgi:hypothetical protein